MRKQNDTLIVMKNGKAMLEKYKGQNLDEYGHIAEMNHEKILEHKVNGSWFMEEISYERICCFLKKEFGYKF